MTTLELALNMLLKQPPQSFLKNVNLKPYLHPFSEQWYQKGQKNGKQTPKRRNLLVGSGASA